jgi:uncharacterized membrane protein
MTYLPPSRPGTAIRIGDAERDAAIGALGDHYAAGRLTKEEYDERADRVTAARFQADLAHVFTDLPPSGTRSQVAESESKSRRRRGPHPALLAAPLLWFAPLLMIGAIALVVVAAVAISPLLLFALFWFACAGFGRGHRAHRHWNRQQRYSAQWSRPGSAQR